MNVFLYTFSCDCKRDPLVERRVDCTSGWTEGKHMLPDRNHYCHNAPLCCHNALSISDIGGQVELATCVYLGMFNAMCRKSQQDSLECWWPGLLGCITSAGIIE